MENWGDYEGEGIMKDVNVGHPFYFNDLETALEYPLNNPDDEESPREWIMSDFAFFTRPPELHLALRAVL